MTTDTKLLRQVEQAQLGDQRSLAELAELAGPRLRAFVFRVTLDETATDDICQETLMKMVDSLSQLRSPERFWPWIYRVATSKIQQHYRDVKQRASVGYSHLEDALLAESDKQSDLGGFGKLVREELSHLVVEAMRRLKERQRAVLALRCYDEMAYSDIAETMGCSELAARVLFVRAKQSLRKQLSRRGFTRGSLVLVLALFGRATAPAEATGITVATVAATQGAGVAATAAGVMGVGKSAVATLMVAGAIATNVMWPSGTAAVTDRSDVNSMHYALQSRSAGQPIGSSRSGGAYETWAYYPQGIDGPLMARQQRWDPQMLQMQCSWLQDGQANYYYNHGANTVHITNGGINGFLIQPTDPPEFWRFVQTMTGQYTDMEFQRDPATSLMKQAIDHRFVDAQGFQTDYEYNTVDYDFFKPYWPEDALVIDERDTMHRRGWTFFRIAGEVAGEPVTGHGRIPFVLNACEKNSAWLDLRIGDDLRIIDTQHGAVMTDSARNVTIAYPAGSFFEGLARPWMGLTAMDTVRRDAASKRIRFETGHADDGLHYEVTLQRGTGYAQTSVVYAIDTERDLIDGVMLSKFGDGDDRTGMMSFEYLDVVEGLEDEFVAPSVTISPTAVRRDGLSGSWLMDLAEGTLLL